MRRQDMKAVQRYKAAAKVGFSMTGQSRRAESCAEGDDQAEREVRAGKATGRKEVGHLEERRKCR